MSVYLAVTQLTFVGLRGGVHMGVLLPVRAVCERLRTPLRRVLHIAVLALEGFLP